MRETTLSLPELALVAGTRVMLGAGLALLLGEQLTCQQKKAVGWTLFLAGALTTIPMMVAVWGRSRESGSGR